MIINRVLLIAVASGIIITGSTRLKADTGTCGGASITLPFTDVSATNIFFCSIAEAYFSGLTNGTSSTTYSPGSPVPREQMAAFVTRTMDQSLQRGSRRAALGRWWTHGPRQTSSVIVGVQPQFVTSDGEYLWVSNTGSNNVSLIHGSDGKLIGNYSNAPTPEGIIAVNGLVLVASYQSPGKVCFIQPELPPGVGAGEFGANLGNNPVGIAFDGDYVWTANIGTTAGTGSISRVLVNSFSADNYTTGFSQPNWILFDGNSLWVTDRGDVTLKRVDPATGGVVQEIPLAGTVGYSVFDGENIWVPCISPDQIYVVRAVGAFEGTVLAQLTGNGLSGPFQSGFDGARILITNGSSNTVSLWKATDLSPIGSFVLDTSAQPGGVCSDGIRFWVTSYTSSGGPNGALIRF